MMSRNSTTLNVVVNNRSGLLSQIVRALVQRGHAVEGQTIKENGTPGQALMSLHITGKRAIPQEHVDAIGELDDDIVEASIVPRKRRRRF